MYSKEVIEVTDNDKLKKFNLKLFEVEYNGDGNFDKETGFMRINSSENFNSEYKDAKDIAMDYLKNKLNTYGLTELNQFRIRKVAESLTGEFVYFSPYINDIPVYQTNFTVFIDKNKTVRFVSNGFRNISKEQEISLESLPKETGYNEAIDIAKKYLNVLEPSNIIREPAGWLTYFESKDKGLLLTWAVNVSCYKPAGSWYVFIDANDKQVVHIEDHTDHYTTYVDIPALVHNPNPLVTKRVDYEHDPSWPYNLRYVGGNFDNPTLNAAREQVILRDVMYETNFKFYQIEGPYCDFDERVDPKTENAVQIFNNPSVIDYKRYQREFATINCYYHVDKSARRLKDLGYYIDNTGLKDLVVDLHGNETCFKDEVQQKWGITFNTINYMVFQDEYPVNSWEDADHILHEHEHAIQYHFGVGLTIGEDPWEHGAVKNGCSDYWVASHKLPTSDYRWTEFAIWCRMLNGWNISLDRNINYNLRYPQNFTFNNTYAHENGRIFSSALMKIQENIKAETNSTVGRDIADKLFLEMHFRWSNPTNMFDAANAYLESSKYYENGKYYCTVFNTLNEFGLIANPNLACSIIGNSNFNSSITDNNVIIQNANINNGVMEVKACNDVTIDNSTIKQGTTLKVKATQGQTTINDFIVEEGAVFVVE